VQGRDPIRHGFRATATNAVRVFAAESLMIPTGVITAAFLTRRLGPSDYGTFTLAATVASWLGWFAGAMYSRATVKLISAIDAPAPERSPVIATMVRAYAASGAVAAMLLFVGANGLARLFNDPALATYFRLFALEVALFAFTMVHKEVLIGLGRFRQRAICAAARWTSRMVLILALVGAGMSVTGAVIGSVAAVAVELVTARHYVRPAFFGRDDHSRRLWPMVAPLIGYSVCTRLFNRVDLFALKALGGSAADAGFYGAAQNLTIGTSLLTLSFVPLLLANLVTLRHRGGEEAARRLAGNSVRFVVLLLPLAAVAAGGADRLVRLLFGAPFLPTASIFSLLVFGEIASVLAAVSTVLIIAKDRHRATFVIAAAVLGVAVVGHLSLIPRFGALGAASVTAAAALGGAVATTSVARVLWDIPLPVTTAARAVVLAALGYFAATFDVGSDWLVVPQMAAIAVAITAGFLVTGELTATERAGIAALVSAKRLF